MALSRGGILAALALGAAGVALMVACEAVPMTAPAGTAIFLQANPSFVEANGGRSLVTAFLTEPAGTLVPDGTVVFFFTNLGSIEEQVKTVNGLAKTFFVADSRSGTAVVTAYSGGPAPPSASPSPTPTPTPGAASTAAATAASSASGTGNASIEINIGSALPANVIVTAGQQVLASNRQTEIIAYVLDARGNPVRNVPVVFKVEATPLQEFLSSEGLPQFTDSSGQAFDTLTTRAAIGTTQKVVTVEALTPNGAKGDVRVVVNYLATR
jgi:hypothetical protein